MVRERGVALEGADDEVLTDEEYTKILLDVVRKIRSQKQRPSLQRINNMVRSHHRISLDTIEKQLELAVAEGHILKIHNKGDYSYRDPKRIHALKSRKVTVDSGTNLLKVLLRTIKEINDPLGSTPKSIEKFILHGYEINLQDGDISKRLRSAIKDALHEEYIEKNGQFYKLAGKKPLASALLHSHARKTFTDMALPEEKGKVCVQVSYMS